MRKKTLLTLIALTVWGITAIRAQDFIVGNIQYSILSPSENTVEVVSKTPLYSGAMTIPATATFNGVTYSVVKIGNKAFENCVDLIRVELSEGITTIGDNAFSTCNNLISLTLPESLTTIGGWFIMRCTSLATLHFPKNVSSLGYYALESSQSGVGGLQSVTVAEDNQHYSAVDGVLYNKDKTTVLFYPAAKPGTRNNVPEALQTKAKIAFYFAKNLTEITFPETLKKIEASVFQHSGVKSVFVSKNLTEISSRSFYDSWGLESITVAEDNPEWSSVDGVLFNKDKTTLILYPKYKPGTEYEIPSTVTKLGRWAFDNTQKYLTSLTIPAGVTEIGEYGALLRTEPSFTITCKAIVPPVVNYNVFLNANTHGTLYVPVGSLAAYQVADQWEDFGTIEEKVFTGLTPSFAGHEIEICGGKGVIYVTSVSSRLLGGEVVKVYNLSGALVRTAPLGNIANIPSGAYVVEIGARTEKVVVQ